LTFVTGSIRRECLDHVVVLSERHLRHVLTSYLSYYHRTRTHFSLPNDAPDGRPPHHLAFLPTDSCLHLVWSP
jgi:hypothetical protein